MDSVPSEHGAAETTLSARIAAFCRYLRFEHGFRVGIGETCDALRAVEVVGITRQERFRSALRAVVCGKFEEIPVFERAFDAFFLEPIGVASSYRVRRERTELQGAEGQERSSEQQDSSEGASWEALLAKYSPIAGRSSPPLISPEGSNAYRRAVNALVARVHLGRSRRWKPLEAGSRFDLRRTLRASLHTGGDPVQFRRLGHPHRNPRFVLLIDGSRSMTEHTRNILEFSRALARRSRRTNVFVFSTELREITRGLRRAELPDLGEAWGGGTRIGATLRVFIQKYGSLLGDDTMVLVFSDGLDLGDADELADAAAELRRRSAAFVWVSPDAGLPGYAPATRGMRAVLPSLSGLASTDDLCNLGQRRRARESRF